MQSADTSRQRFIRIGAMAGITGSVAGAMGNILHPAVPDAEAGAAQTIADSAIWVPVHLDCHLDLSYADGARGNLRSAER
jgi:hypothetical protein